MQIRDFSGCHFIRNLRKIFILIMIEQNNEDVKKYLDTSQLSKCSTHVPDAFIPNLSSFLAIVSPGFPPSTIKQVIPL